MRFDMHCHTKEGSIDANINILTYIQRLIAMGYDGMLITDHNSYKGYEAWKKIEDSIVLAKPFTVLKGIEYDTIDGGHFLVILPDDIDLKLLEYRGMKARRLINIVHHVGGILGPAHPCGPGTFSLLNSKIRRQAGQIVKCCDFIETYNGCEKPFSNIHARILAHKYRKPAFAGSDAHRLSVIGCAYTDFKENIYSNNDLINALKHGAMPAVPTLPGQTSFEQLFTGAFDGQTKEALRALPKKRDRRNLLQLFIDGGYWVYNHLFSLINFPVRMREIRRYQTLYKQ